jgi:TPR repeat protein
MRGVGLLSGVAFAAAWPSLACDGSRAGTFAGAPSPSASVVTIAAEIGSCADLRLCEEECEAGQSDRCRRLGVNYEFGRGVDVDGAHATALYETACTMKNTDACVAAGRMYEFHHGVTEDDAKAVSFYTRACDGGDATGCVNLGIMLEHGRGIARDIARAASLYGAACDQGSQVACARKRGLE